MIDAISRMHLSSGREIPSGDLMAFHVANAVDLWQEIPAKHLDSCLKEAIIVFGNFASVPNVVKCWRERKGNPQLGAGRMNEQETRKYLDWLESHPRQTTELFGEISRKLGAA